MSNINWITTRREEVSQILVDSLQLLGKKSTVKGILAGNASLNRTEIWLPPNDYANTIQSSNTPSLQATSSSHSSNSRRSMPVVPKLDIDALTYQQCPMSRSKGASQLGNAQCNHYNHVCTTCGEVTTPSTYPDSISVLSESSQSEAEESKVNDHVPEDFIMNNVDLDYSSDKQVKPNINEFGIGGSIISITCANPEEIIGQRNEHIRKVMTDSQTMTDSDSEIFSPPFAITRHNAITVQNGMDSRADSASTLDSIPEIVEEFHDTSQLSHSNQFILPKRIPESLFASRYTPASPQSPVASTRSPVPQYPVPTLPVLLKNTSGGSQNDTTPPRRVSLGFKLQPDPQAHEQHDVIVTAPAVAKPSRGNKLRNMFRFPKTDKVK